MTLDGHRGVWLAGEAGKALGELPDSRSSNAYWEPEDFEDPDEGDKREGYRPEP